MHSIIGLIFISLPSLFSPHVLVAAETHNFAPNWKNCNPVQSSVITKAWEGAFKMAERLKDKVDWRENPAALDFFGKETLDAYGADFLIEVFRYVTNTKFTPLVFCGTADANYGVPTTCANSWIYADIASSSFKNITMLFCDGFFKLPSLEARMVEVEQLYVVPWTRLDLTTFYPNQGTSMLRELVTYVPQTSKINNKISKNWVRVLTTSRRGDGEAHIGCFGPICAKILARLYGANWSTKNADNYAALALSEYVKDTVAGAYTWFPRLDKRTFQGLSMDIAVPIPGHSPQCEWVRINTDQFSLASIMYSSYIINNDSNPIENLEAELKIMDIRGVGYRRNDSMPPSLLKERDQAVSDYSACGLLGWAYCGLMRNIACASKNTTRFPDQQWVFSSGNALDLVKQYCTSVVKADSNMEIDPPILTGARTNAANHSKSLGSYWNQAIGNGTQLNLAVSLDQERCETPFNLGTAFEGRLDSGQTWGKEKEQSCIDTFMHIIQGCDTETGVVKRGGVLRIGCKVFTALASSPDKVIKPPDINDMGKFTCAPSNLTTAWRHERYSRVDIAKTCTCWFEKLPGATDMFCPPPEGGCESISAPPWMNAMEIAGITGKSC